MNADQVNADELVELITWVLDRILKHQYEVTRESPDEILFGERLGPFKAASAGEIEGVIRSFATRAHIPHEEVEAFFALKERRTVEGLEESLRSFRFSLALASHAAQELDGADWEDILFYVDKQLNGLAKLESEGLLGDRITKEREGFSSPGVTRVERLIDDRFPNLLSLLAARKYAAEFRQLFPEVVKRATAPEFRLLTANKQVQESVRQYLIEASRCYVYGFFLASLILCRSAIEEAVKKSLEDIDMAPEKEDRLVNLLKLAKRENLLDETRYKMAVEVKNLADAAVHGKELPGQDECIQASIKTRGILEYLYGRLQ